MTKPRHLEPTPGATGPLEILEPYLWVHTLGGISTVEGIVKLPGPERRRDTSAEVRRELLEQAERAITAMEEAGWVHTQHPEFTIGGNMDRDGSERWLRAEATLRLYMREAAP